MATFDFSLWLANINLKPAERAEALDFIREAQFTYEDLANCDLDFAKQFFSKETLPSFCIAALFRIQKAISDLKKMEQPPQQAAPIEARAPIAAPIVPVQQQPLPPSRDVLPDPPAPAPQLVADEPAAEAPSSVATITRWTTDNIIHWLRSSPEMVKIKSGTLDKIVDLVRRLELTGSQLLEGDISKRYKEEFKEISLGGKHKLRKAIKALVATSKPNADQPSPPSDPSNAPPVVVIPQSQPPSQPQHQPPSQPQSNPQPQALPAFAAADMHQSPLLSGLIAQPAPSAHPELSVSPMHSEEEKQPMGQGFFNPVPSQAPSLASSVVQPAPMMHAVNPIAAHPAPVVSGALKSYKRTWYWYNDDTKWYPYEDATSEQIENAYNSAEDSLSLTTGPFFEGRPGHYGIKFDKIVKVHYQINYRSGEQRPVVSGDHPMLREMACAAQPLSASMPAPATVPILPPQQGVSYAQNANGYGANGFGQYQGGNGYVPQQYPPQFGGGAQPFADNNFQAPGGGH